MRKFLIILLSLTVLLFLSPPGVFAATEKNDDIITEEETEKEEIDPSQYQPQLIIEKVNTEKAVAGGIFYATLVIRNNSEQPAFNIVARVSTPKEKRGDPIFTRAKKSTASGQETENDLEMIAGGETRSLTFGIEVDPEAENRDYNLLITLEYRNAFREESPLFRSTASINVPVTYELTHPLLDVNNVKLDPKEPSAGEHFTAIFYLDNYSSEAARNVTVELDGMDNFRVVDFTNKKYLQSVSRGGNNFVLFKLAAEEKRAGNSVKLKFTYDGEDTTPEIEVNLPLGDVQPGKNPFLKLKSFSIEETARPGEHLIRLTLENIGQEKAYDINLTLDGGSDIYVTRGSNVDYLEQLEGEKETVLEYYLGINTSQGTLHYPLELTMEYTDRTGKSYSSSETLGISSNDLDPASTAAGTPRVLINKYTLSDEKILAGNIVTLTLFIENTHARPVQNIKTSISVIKVEGSDGTETGGTVFSPVDGSNSFFIEQIPARTTVERSIDLLVDPNATAKTYIVPITIEYEDQKANSYSVEEMVNIPVTQECKLQILSTEVPPTAFIGQPTFIGAEFVNVGKVALNNFIVMLEGNFHKEQASYFVGNLQIGASDYYQGIVYPEKEGTLSGKLVFSYIDNNNREVQVEEPFQLEVLGARAMEPMPGDMPPEMMDPGAKAGGGSTKKIFFYVIPIVILAAIAIFLWRRKKKKQMEDEELLDA